MILSAHTPGPWLLRQGKEGAQVDTKDGTIATDISWVPDARLITAAPDLLEVCKSLLEWVEVRVDELGQSSLTAPIAEARAAIAKAEGA